MINPYHDRLDIQKIVELQAYQYQDAILVEGDVPANGEVDLVEDVTALGHFMMLSVTGSFTTKTAADADDGINHLFAKLEDGTNNRSLFGDFIPANLFLSPGRVRAVAGLGDASDQLFLEYPFIYTFPMKGDILLRMRNDAAFDNHISVMFKGIRIFPDSRQLS